METKVYGDTVLLHKYLEALLGSKTKIKILRTLNKHKGKEFTIRELSDYINTSHTGVRKALQDLYEMNTVTLQTAGRSHTVHINEKSHLTPLLSSLFKYEENTVQELQKDIKKHLCHQPIIESVKIFGSVAQGKEKPRSDIDLLVVTSDTEKAEEIITQLQIYCNNKYGNPVMPRIVTSDIEDPLTYSNLIEEIEKTREP